jgi:hypothetical protein
VAGVRGPQEQLESSADFGIAAAAALLEAVCRLADYNVRINVPQLADRQAAAEIHAASAGDLRRACELLAEIEEARPLRNAVRPGDTVTIELKIRPWRAEPAWTTVEVKVPADFPEGTCRLYLCGADEALRQEQREVPVRFRPDDVDSLLATMQRGERRDQLFIRIEAPGAGLAIGQQELPNLPPTMRAVLADSARRQVTGVTGALVTKQASPYILSGSRTVEIAVSRKAPEK